VKKTAEKLLFKGNWISIKELAFINENHQEILWESIQRNHDARIIVILAKCEPSNRYILIKQFRPAFNAAVIGFPAGLCSDNDISSQALKELKEETGYTGKITAISPPLAFNPALSDETAYLVRVTVDESDPENINPKQTLKPSEEIEALLIPAENTAKWLKEEQEKGIHISASVWYLLNNQSSGLN